MDPNTAASSVRELCANALYELNAVAAGETPDAESLAFCLSKLARLLDQWNAQRPFAYTVNFSLFTLQANHAPHTIGPSGDFPVAQRPVKIEAASLVLDPNGQSIDLPIMVEDDDWWALNTVKNLVSTIPTHLYYSPDFPNGNLNFWPIPSAVYGIRLEMWLPLNAAPLTLDSAITLPPGYEEALTLTLAERIARPMGTTIDADLRENARKARILVQSNNLASPRLDTQVAGMPNRDHRPRYNFLTGKPW